MPAQVKPTVSQLKFPTTMPSKAEMAAAFKVFDADADGSISVAELKAILTRPVGSGPPKLTDTQVEQFMKRFDTDGDGVLSVDEFAEAFMSITTDKASLEQMMQLVAAPAGETFGDLVPEGAGCTIEKTEERGISIPQLVAMGKHIERRCDKEGWRGGYPEKTLITPKQVALYEACAHAIKVLPPPEICGSHAQMNTARFIQMRARLACLHRVPRLPTRRTPHLLLPADVRNANLTHAVARSAAGDGEEAVLVRRARRVQGAIPQVVCLPLVRRKPSSAFAMRSAALKTAFAMSPAGGASQS